jgi:hypothetical protein
VDVNKGIQRSKRGGPAGEGVRRSINGEEGRALRKRIGLVCNGKGPSQDALKYAVNACESLGAHLDVLHFHSSEDATERLNELITHLGMRGVHFTVVKGSADQREEKKEILKYAKGSSDILFVVIDEMSWKGIMPYGSGRSGSPVAWDSRCPLVVISEQTPGSRKGGQP